MSCEDELLGCFFLNLSDQKSNFPKTVSVVKKEKNVIFVLDLHQVKMAASSKAIY
jgi:hypothetical protein